MEFTGEYYQCINCRHIWDYMDNCPGCGDGRQESISQEDIKSLILYMFNEQKRLKAMLESHGDL